MVWVLDGLRMFERVRMERCVVVGWSVVGYSAGGLVVMEVVVSVLGSELGLMIVNLVMLSVWNLVSLMLM